VFGVRTTKSVLPVLLILAFLLGGCSYYFPHVYDGPTQKIYMPTWKNRTSNLGLDVKIYQSLARWFQKSQSIVLSKNKAGADLILAGEIVSIDLPSIAWNANSRATEVKVRLNVRYILKDLQTDEILWEVPKEMWSEEYSTLGGSTAITENENEALDQILEELSERLYLGTLDRLRRLNMKTK
jgi:hypothetical protein